MIYRVKLDGSDILNWQEKRYTLLSPTVEIELNTAGSFTFTLPPSHPFYDSIKPFISTIEVFEDETLIWFGRVLEITTGYKKNREIYCEGALAFFNDTIQRPHEYTSIYVHEFFRTVISNHNQQVAADRQFTVGQITIPNIQVYRNLRYESTMDVLKRQCLNAKGGYFFTRRENGVNYIDWLQDLPYDSNQTIEFGLNLLDLSSSFSGDSFCTCVIPLGEDNLTVAEINNGSDLIVSEAAETYGRITKVATFSSVKYPDTLYEDGLEYLQEHQFDDLIITCSAADLHWENKNFELFRVGQKIHCRSIPHLIDKVFNLSKITVKLDTTQKTIQLGTLKRETLTEITNNNESELDVDAVETIVDSYTRTEVIPPIQEQIDNVYTAPTISEWNDRLEEDGQRIVDLYEAAEMDPPFSMDDFSVEDYDDVRQYISTFSDASDAYTDTWLDRVSELDSSMRGVYEDAGVEYPVSEDDMPTTMEEVREYMDTMSSSLAENEDALSGSEGYQDAKDTLDEWAGYPIVPDDEQNMITEADDAKKDSMSLTDLDERMSNAESHAMGWTFQIDGQTVSEATVNFVTGDSS